MRYIKDLDEETIKKLEKIVKEDKRYKNRYRAQAILLSNQGKTVNEISNIFECKIRTIYGWFNRFEEKGIEGISELKGRGRKLILTIEEDEERVKEYLRQNLTIDEICIAFEKEFIDGKNKIVTKGTLKRFLKKIGVTYTEQ